MRHLRPAILLIIGFIAPSAWGAHSVELRHASRELDHAADAFYQTLEHRLGDGALLADAEYFADGAYEFALRVDSYENPAVLWNDFQRLVDRFDYLARAFHADSYASYQSHVANDFYAIEVAMDRLGNAFRAMPRYRQSFTYSYSRWPWYEHRFWVHYHRAPPVHYYAPSIYVHNYYSSGTRRTHIARFKRRGHSHQPRHRVRHFPPNRVAGASRQHRGYGNRRHDGNNRFDRNRRNERDGRNHRGERRARNENRRALRPDNVDANTRHNSRRGGDRQERGNDRRRTWTSDNRAAAQPNTNQSRRDNRRNGSILAPPRNSGARNDNRRQARQPNAPRQGRAAPANNRRNQQTRVAQPNRPGIQNRARRAQPQRQANARPTQSAGRRNVNRRDRPRSNSSNNRGRSSSNSVRPREEPRARRDTSNNGTRRRMERR